ncbi:DUF5959 family protein [Streptomyces sp. HUAS ZL42]|uniref:DUF5959 family protein n=1 Tax=Streptomyces sp. HUAS ZL42 TaxID=3231715 RepID=UPI00345ECC1B
MTNGDRAADLIRLSDGDNSFRLRVLGRRSPGILPGHDLLDAEIVIESSFVHGRLPVCFRPADLESWRLALDGLEAGQDLHWLDTGNGPTVNIEFSADEPGLPYVRIEDGSASGASAVLPVAVEDGWVQDLREQLDEVRRTWPSEVRETSPGAYEWNR